MEIQDVQQGGDSELTADGDHDSVAAWAWEELLNPKRRKEIARSTDTSNNEASAAKDASGRKEVRTAIERDHDRILFSTPVRRLADKTQVFPLDKNDSVRDRLTHSIEVSNLARSFGTILAERLDVSGFPTAHRDLPALCAAIGLVHDLGNPPFGHQGEAAIQHWFASNPRLISTLTEAQRRDFSSFEGNAQGFRLVTKLQLLNDNYGLDLTYASLAAMMKYPVQSCDVSDKKCASKKHGFFQSEKPIAEEVMKAVGLDLGRRHPLAYAMEACDDIAYCVFDAEDCIKKGLASISDLHEWLKHECRVDGKDDELVFALVKFSEKKTGEYRARGEFSPSELNDISMQRFRAEAIGLFMDSAVSAFVKGQEKFADGTESRSLLDLSAAKALRKCLKSFSLKHGYTHRSVLKVELTGFNVINRLMDMFWAAITDRESFDDPKSKRKHPFTRLAYERISENYRRAFENPQGASADLPMRYREAQLLTDMIAGMTDSFAMDLCEELEGVIGDFSLQCYKE
ncbi:dNTP triphosphohydrolase [Stenotrophomonas sp. GD03777]|uniref:dGTP triphosphohydrolase n=1 Tax=unclassified Stenotrophomonas TaxID=196198 RepID=UPI001BAF8DB3|nr:MULTISPECIES: dNTP triphosphohydrolase [unclassified Stenotrophomonas]MBS3726840.1 Deoxyguanosinetriphosphate triphosphohydrolase [Stenotrophomonas sp. PE591]MDH1662687.1 dNTP triphosphohydrolase [Stenotrophomonas sp. GD03777]